MASSRKPRNADPAGAAGAFLAGVSLEKQRVVVGLSGGMDSVVLLHILAGLREPLGFRLGAIHVHHGLSRHADSWARFCSRLCKSLDVPLRVKRVRVTRKKEGLEAAAREARYTAFKSATADAIALAHHLDDQAETVLFNLLRGAGMRGLSGIPARSKLGDKLLLRPLLELPREALAAYAKAHGLRWIEDDSNEDETLTRNFLRRQVGPLLASRFPAWRESLARAARHAARKALRSEEALREFLRGQGLRAPSERRLAEMLKQFRAAGTRTAIGHDGKVLRMYRGRLLLDDAKASPAFRAVPWTGEKRIPLPALGGAVSFTRGAVGVDSRLLKEKRFSLRLRGGGERLQPDPKRPRRTLKNLFQEAGVPPHERERLPLLFCGEELVWVPGLGVDARFQVRDGLAPRWRRDP